MKRGIIRFLSVSLFFALIIGIMTPIGSVKAEDSNEVGVIVNSHSADFDVPPRVENDRTLVPLRKIFEMLGATVNWDDSTSTATATKGTTTVTMKFDDLESHNVTVNGKTVSIGVSPLEVPPKIVNDRVLVPLRFVSEAMGATVNFDQDMSTVFIASPVSLGVPKKVIGSLPNTANRYYISLNEQNALIVVQHKDGMYSNFQFYNPVTNQIVDLAIQATTSIGLIEDKIYYISGGTNEVHVFDPYTNKEVSKISFPIQIHQVLAAGNHLIIEAVLSTDKTKGGYVYVWNVHEPASNLIRLNTPNEGTYTYTIFTERISGLIFYRKTFTADGSAKTYILNSKNGKFHGYQSPNGILFQSLSQDGQNIVLTDLTSYQPNPLIKDHTLISWLDSSNVLFFENGNLAVHDLQTDKYFPIDSSVSFSYVYGNSIYYYKRNPDGTLGAYSVAIR